MCKTKLCDNSCSAELRPRRLRLCTVNRAHAMCDYIRAGGRLRTVNRAHAMCDYMRAGGRLSLRVFARCLYACSCAVRTLYPCQMPVLRVSGSPLRI